MAMPRQRSWTPAEDAIIRENAHLGPSWDGYALLLPHRSRASIEARRKRLGVAFAHSGRQKSKLPCSGPWTQEQDETLVLCAKVMVEQTGHSTAECATRLAEIVAAYRRGEITTKGDAK